MQKCTKAIVHKSYDVVAIYNNDNNKLLVKLDTTKSIQQIFF